MADKHEVFNIPEISNVLEIGVQQYPQDTPDTHFQVQPPLSESEGASILQDSNISERLRSLIEQKSVLGLGEFFKLSESPSEDHIEVGIELALQVMSVRGLRVGIVAAKYTPEQSRKYLVRIKSEAELAGEELTVIDAEELAEAQRDPKFQTFAKRARDYGKEQAERERQIENEGKVQLIEATEGTAVLRSHATGKLYGISLDVGSDGEEARLTELEDPANIPHCEPYTHNDLGPEGWDAE